MEVKSPVLVIIGTARENNKTEKIAQYVHAQAMHFGFDAQLVRPQETIDSFITLGTSDTKKTAWSKLASSAQGYIIVSPEYNHGYPGELKLMLDQAYKEYAHKPVGIVVSIELSMIPVRSAVYIREIQNVLDETGNMQDNTLTDRLTILFEDIQWYITQLNK